MNTMPVSASAGSIVRVAGEPECTPIPLTAVCWRSVVCRPAFITMARSSEPHAREACTPSGTGMVPFLPKMTEDIFGGAHRHPPDKPAKIPLICEHFNARPNQRQFTVSYRLLPPNRRKAASNATCDGLLEAGHC